MRKATSGKKQPDLSPAAVFKKADDQWHQIAGQQHTEPDTADHKADDLPAFIRKPG